MEFSIILYETAAGKSPVLDFLKELEETDPDDHAAVMGGLAKLRDRRHHREPLSKPLWGGLFEMRHVGKLNTRVIYFFRKGRRIVAVHAIRNKGQKFPPNAMETALARMKDWIERNSDAED